MASTKSTQRERLEQWSINPDCEINSSSAILNVPLSEVAIVRAQQDREAGRETVAPKISPFPPFARHLGNAFESALFDGNPTLAEILLKEANILGEEIPVTVKKKKSENSDSGEETNVIIKKSSDFLLNIGKNRAGQAFIVNGFSLPGSSIQPGSYLEIDVLMAIPNGADGKYELIVGEVKVYPDKGGRTPAQKTSNTRSQAGLYIYILKNWLEALISSHPDLDVLEVSEKSVLFFQDVRTGLPKITSLEKLHHHYRRSELAIKNMRNLLDSDAYTELLKDSNAHRRIDFVNAQAHKFQDSCWSGCAMASACYLKEVSEDNTLVLGNLVQEQIPNVNLSRAAGLISGRVLSENETESDLVERLLAAKFPELEELR